MPEGPEVATVADKLKPKLFDKIITSAYKGERGTFVGFENLKFPSRIIGVRSHGKKLLIDIEYGGEGFMIIISLGMSGRLQYNQGNHSHIHFSIGEYQVVGMFQVLRPSLVLYFDDQRYMGGVNLIPNAGIPFYFRNIGPDLLQAALDEKTYITLEHWRIIFNPKKVQKWTVRKALMDQSLVASIGNYIVSEVLYYAMICPERIVSTLTDEEWDRLRIVAHKILFVSYSYGGFTIKDFISPDMTKGMYPAAVYGRKTDPYGNPVVKVKAKDGRTSHWVPAIQH